MYRELALARDGARDDLWCLARLVVAGDFGVVASQLLPAGRRPFHPARRTAHTRARGVEITQEPVEFVFHAALLVREPVLLTRFTQYLVSHKLWTPARRAHAAAHGWTPECLARALGEQYCE